MKKPLMLIAAFMFATVANAQVSTEQVAASVKQPRIGKTQFRIEAARDSAECRLTELQTLVDNCSKAGGGRVCVGAGVYYLAGPLNMRSGVELHLEKGARLKFSGRASDFLPAVFTRWEGTELFNRSAMIYARNAHDIAITGSGVIDAQGGLEMASWGMVPGETAFEENVHGTHGVTVEKPDVDRLRHLGETLAPITDRMFGAEAHLRPCAVEFVECSRILIDGITLRNSPFWCIHPLYSNNVTVRGVTIDSHFPNNDGCDPESSADVLIEKCVFNTGDDAIAIKAGRDADGRAVGRPSRRIVIRDCVFNSHCNGLCIGSEMSGGVSDVFMKRVKIGKVKNALLFKSNLDRGGYIRRVEVDSINIVGAEGAVLRFETNYFGYRGGNFPAQYEDFTISNVNAGFANGYAVYYDGNAQCPIRNIDVSNFCVGRAAVPYYLYHTTDCTFRSSMVGGETLPERPANSPEHRNCDVW